MTVKEIQCEEKLYQRHLNFLKDFIARELKASKKRGLVIGLSGGVDSAACLYLAVSAIGKDNVRALYMPHKGSLVNPDVSLICGILGVKLKIYDLTRLTAIFSDLTGERDPVLKGNFAARLRNAFLYQEAASLDMLVLNTSNRSEIMTGYFTKWGDQAGDISPFADYYKSEVLQMASILGVPGEILSKAPSPDFFEGQTDKEELGISYSELDKTLAVMDRGEECKADSRNLLKLKRLIEKSSHKRNSPLMAKRPE